MKAINFIDYKFCVQNGFHTDLSIKEFTRENKRYYQEVENYDWVKVTDRFQGLEAILHRLREKETLSLVRKFAKGNKYLDAGCGTGLILRHLPSDSYGLDINPRNLRLAKSYAPKARLVLGDIEKIPFPDKKFTTIICTDVLEHLLQPQKAVNEIFRILSDDGILIGSVPAQNWLWRLRFLSSTHPGEPYHRLYKKSEVRNLLNGKGKILKINNGCLFMNLFFVVKND